MRDKPLIWLEDAETRSGPSQTTSEDCWVPALARPAWIERNDWKPDAKRRARRIGGSVFTPGRKHRVLYVFEAIVRIVSARQPDLVVHSGDSFP